MTARDFDKKVISLAPQVYPLAYRMLKSDDLAQDAVQQAMLKLWEKRKNIKANDNIKAFLFTTVRNLCLDEIKRKKPKTIDYSENIIQMVYDDEVHSENREMIQMVEKVIETLPDIQKEVIKMRDIDGLEFDEIAEILQLESAYIRVSLSRARKRVRIELEKIYAYDTAGQK